MSQAKLPERIKDEIDALLGGEAADVGEDEGLVGRAKGPAAGLRSMPRGEVRDVHAAAPDPHIAEPSPLQVVGDGLARREGPTPAVVEPPQVSPGGGLESAGAVEPEIGGEGGVI